MENIYFSEVGYVTIVAHTFVQNDCLLHVPCAPLFPSSDLYAQKGTHTWRFPPLWSMQSQCMEKPGIRLCIDGTDIGFKWIDIPHSSEALYGS